MNAITVSAKTMVVLLGALALYGLHLVLAIVAYATLSGDSSKSFDTFRDLAHASDWLAFVAFLIALGAICVTAWDVMTRPQRDQMLELAAAAVATLLITIGSLVAAASDTSQASADVLKAVGVGGWALLAFARAARLNLVAQQAPAALARQMRSWLAVSGGLLLFAIGTGFNVELDDQVLGIISGVLQAVGLALVAASIFAAHVQGLLPARSVEPAIPGIVMAAASGVSAAVVAGLVFTPDGTLKGLRIGISITDTIALLAIALLGWSAWRRVGELVLQSVPAPAAQTQYEPTATE